MSRNKYLLGATKDNEIVFGEFEITTRNGCKEFTASFDTVRPFDGDIDLEKYYEEYIDSSDKEYLYDLCERFDCAPSELAGNLADECSDVRDVIDCSLYPECYKVYGYSYYFESGSCGQHDTRNEIEEIINPVAYDLLHELWDNYHLKEMDEEAISKVENLIEMFEKDNIDEEEWIVNYIERHIESGDF